MCRSQMVMLTITIIAILFCSAFIVAAQSTPTEKQTTEESTENQKDTDQKELDERPTLKFHWLGVSLQIIRLST